MTQKLFDVIIVGAGVSGVGAAHHLQTRCPGKTYTILESRDNIGGTWDLFRYPGIRSDSDMYTFGYAFRPWTKGKSFADGDSIREYVQATATEAGIDQHIQFGWRVQSANWDSAAAQWELVAQNSGTGQTQTLKCAFLIMCSGYYRYDRGHVPDFDGIDDFSGDILHPQHWPQEYDYSNKRIVIVGSGATAVTLLPAMAATAKHVTMLQRSPSYIGAVPSVDHVANILRRLLPGMLAHRIIRLKNILLITFVYQMARWFPRWFKWQVKRYIRSELGDDFNITRHFTPTYAPWDQRFCVAPDGDFFQVLKDGSASIVTDHIERITESGVALRSGEALEADAIVLATGLDMQVGGGIEVSIDHKVIEPASCISYRGMMLAPLPNLAIGIGYTNNSWTLKIDLMCERVCRLLNHMDRKGYVFCVPVPPPQLNTAPLLNLKAGYVERAKSRLPRQGTVPPWRTYQNYFLDMLTIRYGKLEDGALRFSREPD
jgi:monooxygenase